MNDAIELIKEEDLTTDLQLIADVCGIDIVKVLLRHLSGLSFYIPKISHLDSFIERYIKMNLNKNLKQIASELKVSEQFLKNLRKKN